MNASQRARNRLRWEAVPIEFRMPTPTPADCAAHAFQVMYRAKHTTLSFPVLALDEQHAAVLADIRMADTGRDTKDFIHPPTCTQWASETSVERMASLLRLESAEEWQDRQCEYACRVVPVERR